MEILYLLIPLSVLFAALIVSCAIWAVKNDQFENMDDAATRILSEPEPKAKPDNK
ncbi:MAG: cbb3-type cytochrome oxidase assembly protein CcoS [Acidiferrobacterales bacterium]|nr:cbb3-type cytochrome oxidase assembly protein CcoS [Acidiferrobacterales bacterium]